MSVFYHSSKHCCHSNKCQDTCKKTTKLSHLWYLPVLNSMMPPFYHVQLCHRRSIFVEKQDRAHFVESLLAWLLTLNIQTCGMWASAGTLALAPQMFGVGVPVIGWRMLRCRWHVLRALPVPARRGQQGWLRMLITTTGGEQRMAWDLVWETLRLHL